MLEGLTRFGWKPIVEAGHIIGLLKDGASVSLEPGGQFELSGAPLEDMHQICAETGRHLEEVKAVADELGLGFIGLGFSPLWRRDEVPVMPKGRYDIMRAYMPTKGGLGLDMMLRTCTVQSNHDFADEADMVAKFRTSLALQPLATALFANSPFVEGRPAASCPPAPTSGPTPIPTARACWTLSSPTVSASRLTPSTRSTCPCTSPSAAANTSIFQDVPSATSCAASCPNCQASAPG
jgi:hypothetical protein